MTVYTFDVKFFSSINIKADSEKAAREILDRAMEIAIGEATFAGNIDCFDLQPDGEADLTEIDGEMAR